MTITMYGIRNCDTIKKARAWLDERKVEYVFHDYKAAGIAPDRLRHWCQEMGWENLLNRAGTTFRKLPEADKRELNEERAISLMLAHPSMIKRPLLDLGRTRLLGFSPQSYQDALRTLR